MVPGVIGGVSLDMDPDSLMTIQQEERQILSLLAGMLGLEAD